MFATARLNEDQIIALGKAIEGRDVHDFGCGVGVFTRALEQLGPKSVVGIDKEHMAMELANKHMRTDITKFVCADFAEYAWDSSEAFDVGIISWPVNWRNLGLVQLLERCKTIIYIGKNTNSTACGGPELFEYLVTREVVEYIPAFTNVLCVYGAPCEPRCLTGEEFAALSQWGREPVDYTMEEAEAAARRYADLDIFYVSRAKF